MPSAPLRIWKRSPASLRAAETATDIQETPYYERLLKLIPAEIISIYMIGKGVIPSGETGSGETVGWIWAGVCLVLLVLLRVKASSSTGKLANAQWPSILIAAVSYVIWLYNMGGILDDVPFYKDFKYLGALAILVWTFVVPFFYKGDEPAS